MKKKKERLKPLYLSVSVSLAPFCCKPFPSITDGRGLVNHAISR